LFGTSAARPGQDLYCKYNTGCLKSPNALASIWAHITSIHAKELQELNICSDNT